VEQWLACHTLAASLGLPEPELPGIGYDHLPSWSLAQLLQHTSIMPKWVYTGAETCLLSGLY